MSKLKALFHVKVRSLEHCKFLQEKLFEKGYKWNSDQDPFKIYEQKEGYIFAMTDNKLLKTKDPNYFKNHPYDKDIGIEYVYDSELDDFIGKIKKTKYLFDV